MRIALVLPRFGSNLGGVERYAWELAHGIARAGHEAHVVCHRGESDGTRGIHLREVPVISWHNALKIASFSRAADRLVAEGASEFDVVHGFGRTTVHDLYRVGGGVHRAYLARMRAESGRAWLGLWQRIDPRNRVIDRIEARIFRRGARRFTAISRLCARDVEDHYGIPAAEIEVVYNGVDVEVFHPGNRDRFRASLRREHQLRDDETGILFVGTGFRRKGLDTLIAALGSLAKEAPLRLFVVGKGNEGAHRRQAKSLSIEKRVTFLGPRSDLAALYAMSDVFVLPTRYEPFGTVCLEAWATGLPVVVSRMSGASEVMTPGDHGAILEDPESADELAARLRPFLSPEERARVAPLARELACRHTIQANIDRTIAIYGEVARGKVGVR